MNVELTDELYQSAMPVLQTIESHGYEAYFVGGCVRDTLLHLPIHDIDIASSATPDEIEAIFTYTFEVGKEHGTIVVLHQRVNYEVTTFRTEGHYSDKRHPDQVTFVRSLREDTLRRDFTINALAFNRQGTLFDYHGGVADLQQRIIRAVGVPYERFNEDALRMMRAVRFASQLGFTIEPHTLTAIQQLAPTLQHVSIERIRIELTKLLQGDYMHQAIEAFHQSGLTDYLIGFQHAEIATILQVIADQLSPIEQPDEVLCWFVLVQALSYSVETLSAVKQYLRQWKHSNQLIRDVCDLLELDHTYQQGAMNDWTLYSYSEASIQRLELYYLAHHRLTAPVLTQQKSALPIQSRQALQVDGKQLMALFGLTRGNAQIGQLLNTLEQQVVAGQLLNQQEILLAAAQQLGDEIRVRADN